MAAASYRPFALERRFWWDFNAKRWLSSRMAQSSKRAAESCLVFIGRELFTPNTSSLFFASDTMGTKVCWSMFSVCRIRLSDTVEFSPRRLFMSSEGGKTLAFAMPFRAEVSCHFPPSMTTKSGLTQGSFFATRLPSFAQTRQNRLSNTSSKLA